MAERQPLYIASSIPYVNAPPHIGFALELIYADAYARYARLLGKEVMFSTGADEHGTKISRKAKEKGVSPQQFTDETSELFRSLSKDLNISITDFYRTTDARHKKPVEEFWRRVYANGYIYKKAYKGLYCVGCESFKPEKDLVEGKCPDHNTVPEYFEEENYFFALSAFQERLLALYAERPEYVLPEAKFNEMKQLVEGGLEDISISRSRLQLEWGVGVPDDPTQVIYVWFDALINYVSCAGFGSDEKTFARFWPTTHHIIGKDINRFHSVLWTAMLMAADLPLPQQICVHGWVNVDGQKMSKSLGNVIDPYELKQTYGVDAMRYLLLSQVPFTNDGDWNTERSNQKYEADLANNLGNLVFRVTSMLGKYFEGVVPAQSSSDMSAVWKSYGEHMDAFRFDQALDVIRAAATDLNQDIDQTKPWTLAKTGEMEALATCMYRWLESIRHIGWMLRPVMPETSEKILVMLGEKANRDSATVDEISKWGGLKEGTKIEAGQPLFPRLIVEKPT